MHALVRVVADVPCLTGVGIRAVSDDIAFVALLLCRVRAFSSLIAPAYRHRGVGMVGPMVSVVCLEQLGEVCHQVSTGAQGRPFDWVVRQPKGNPPDW